MSLHTDRNQTIQHLAQQLRRFERARRESQHGKRIIHSTGIPALDGLLPEQGIRAGTLVEWLTEGGGSGAETLVFTIAVQVMQGDGACIVIDRSQAFYPLAMSRLDNCLDRIIVVHPPDARDALWALEQSLRCSGVRLVVCWLDRLNDRVYRRLQLASETGGGIGLLLRPAEYRSQPSWADVRLLVEPQPCDSDSVGRRLRVELVHCRGRGSEGTVELEIDDETGDVRLAPKLAAAKDELRAAGA